MPTFTEAEHAGAFIVQELEGYYSRDAGYIALSQTVLVGNMLYSNAIPAQLTVAATADASNTGNGVVTPDASTPALAGAQDGAYRAVCIAVAANSGTFAVYDPSGVEIGRVAVAATFNNQIKFVIADGATDWAAGDAITFRVGRESGLTDEEFVPIPNDGSQIVAGIAIYPVVTDGVTRQQIAILKRGAEVRLVDLQFPSGISAANKAKAIEEMRRIGIICR